MYIVYSNWNNSFNLHVVVTYMGKYLVSFVSTKISVPVRFGSTKIGFGSVEKNGFGHFVKPLIQMINITLIN